MNLYIHNEIFRNAHRIPSLTFLSQFNDICDFDCRFGQFQDRDQCFSTYDDDPLTFVQPNNTYKIFYTPIGNDSGEECLVLQNNNVVLQQLSSW